MPSTNSQLDSALSLVDTDKEGIFMVVATEAEARFQLPWDRFMRLKTAADHLRRLAGERNDRLSVLDVGGLDGALALFLPGYDVELIDPATTGGSGLNIPCADRSYEFVVSIDALEHVPPADRFRFLSELTRVSESLCLINIPNPATMPAQKLVASLTGHPFIKEHVELGLPERSWIEESFSKLGFSCQLIPSTSLAMWVAQFTLSQVNAEAAEATSRYLVRAHNEEPFSVPLYYLFIAKRISN